jgi:DNA/RNA endonuclease YhcR with UshA esterase domain
MKLNFILLLIFSTVLVSCKTVKSGTSKSIEIHGVGVIHKPVIVDMDVNQQKTSKTIIVKNMESLEKIKSEIVRELLNENNADLLVEPNFIAKTKNGKTELTVTGWLAFYKNFRMIEEKDIDLLKLKPSQTNTIEVINAKDIKDKK